MPAPHCSGFRQLQPLLSRRSLLELGMLGTAAPLVTPARAWANGRVSLPENSQFGEGTGFGKAKACILMFIWGGPSHLDTWDLKPSAPAEIRGEFQPIATTVPGIQVSEHFPKLSQRAEHLAIVRSVTHDDPAHLSSVHHLLTGRHAVQVKSDAISPSRKDSPQIGAALARLRPGDGLLPQAVTMPWMVNHPAAPGGTAPGQHAGWFGAAFDPFLVTGDPNHPQWQVSGLRGIDGIPGTRLRSRESLLATLDRSDAGSFGGMQQRAFDMLTDPGVEQAFDLSRETPETRNRYGRHIHGQCLLLARRLVEAGVTFVCVNWPQDGANFWDTHGDNFNRLKRDLMPPADAGFSALLQDLEDRHMLDETLLVWVGEFGRRPQITPGTAGREHWPWCGSAVLAGGGIRGGQHYGRSDSQGGYPAEGATSPADIAATMYHALGVPPDLEVRDRTDRPLKLTEGQPLVPLF
ncbi:MAG: DUF1501 domain-containing protein [Planctomycetaceae bacterium]